MKKFLAILFPLLILVYPFHTNAARLLISGSGNAISIQGVPFDSTPPTNGLIPKYNSGTGKIEWAVDNTGEGSITFDGIEAGTNTHSLIIGTDGSLTYGGTGTINSTHYKGITTITSTEFGYLSGVTSAIQTQFGAKAPLASPTFTGAVTMPSPFTLGATSVTATGTQLNFVAGVTGAIQTQLNTKAPIGSPTFTGTVTMPTPFILGATSVTATGTEINYLIGSSSNLQTQITAKAPSANPTFTGTVTLPTPFTIGAVSVTTTGTRLNYLSSATGTTGTTNSNLVFSAGPTFTGTVVIPSPFTLGSTSVTVSGTEINYLTGATSALQAQISAKAPSVSPTFTGTVIIPSPFILGAISVSVSGSEINYLAGVSSAIQTQINTKSPIASPTFTGKVTTQASASGTAGFNAPHGAPPSAPTDGDMWTTTDGLYARINGVTVGPYATEAGGTIWGGITGTLSNQADLQTALDAKAALAGDTFTGKIVTLASASGGAGLNLPHGTAPSSPVNGDCWTTTAGLYCRVDGSTVGPYASSAGAVSWGDIGGTLSAQTDLQTALDAKSTIDSPTFTGTVTIPSPFTVGPTSVTATGAEINYLIGVTSAVQTQLNLKSPIASPTFTGTVTVPTPFTLGAVSVTATGTQINYLASATGTTGTTSTYVVFSASPTFTGTVTIPTPFTLGATSVTSTGTQLNYLASATGTTGTTSQKIVFDTSPTLVTPVLGVATATSINKVAITAPTTSATLTLVTGSSLITSGAYAITLTSTATTGVTLPTSGTLYGTATGSISSAQLLGSLSDETGTGVAVFATTPTLVTPVLGVATATSINKVAITAPGTAATLTIADGASLITSGAYAVTLTATGTTGVTLPTSGTLAILGGGTYTGKIITAASATGGAGFNLPHGVAPTSPVNGDVWTTTAGLYARINSGTVGPFGSSTATIGGTLGTTDNAITRADGTGGVTAQGSLATIDDAGLLTAVTLSSGAGGFTVGSDGATVAKSVTVTKASGVAGEVQIYNDYLTETYGVILKGPTGTMASTYTLQYPNAAPTTGQVAIYGTPMTWLTPAPLASPGLTGTPTAPTAVADTNTTQIATTAFVIGQAGTASPIMDSSATVGTSLRYSRQDHIHPSNTLKANVASPTFTGTVTLPTGGTSAAPLKFVSGSLLSTPVAGTMEFLTDAAYFTISTGPARKTFAFLDSNITGTAANLSGTPALPNGTTATTQSQADNSTKLATTAYVDTGLGGKQASDATLTALAALTIADVSIIEGTGADAVAMVTSGGNNYILGSNSDNTALEFKTPGNVLSQIGAQASHASLASIAGLTETQGALLYSTADNTYAVLAKGTAYQLLQMNSGATAPEWTSTLSLASIDLSSSTFSIPWPVGTAAAPTAEGRAYWNSSTDTLTIGDGAAAKAMAPLVSPSFTTPSLGVATATSLAVAGAISGLIPRGADITSATAHNTTDLHGKVYVFTAAATVTLDAAADAGYGASACYRIRDAGEAAVIDVDNAEKINLRGTALAAGVAITATGAGEYVCLVATTDTDGSGTDGWETWGITVGWVSQ